ncbi:hypothetical protein CAEBREN_30333 [Caenorhabditis brenneri]|nr:hypothetical protein CAEBREN_30333 [Caenorhabditis brenneri]
MPWAFMQGEIAQILGDEFEDFKKTRDLLGLAPPMGANSATLAASAAQNGTDQTSPASTTTSAASSTSAATSPQN